MRADSVLTLITLVDTCTSLSLSLSLPLSQSLSYTFPHHTNPHTSSISYNPRKYYEGNSELKKAVDMIHDGYFSPDAPDLFHDLTYHLLNHDT